MQELYQIYQIGCSQGRVQRPEAVKRRAHYVVFCRRILGRYESLASVTVTSPEAVERSSLTTSSFIAWIRRRVVIAIKTGSACQQHIRQSPIPLHFYRPRQSQLIDLSQSCHRTITCYSDCRGRHPSSLLQQLPLFSLPYRPSA